MLGYRIVINSDDKGRLSWSLTFEQDNSTYTNNDTDRIFGVAREFVAALVNLLPQGTSTLAEL